MACVYAIRNTVNTKLYIGSTIKRAKTRFFAHRSLLRSGKHHSRLLQADWNNYGEGVFELITIENCIPSDCEILEDYYIQHYNTSNPYNGYNVRPRSERRTELTEEERDECKDGFVIDLEELRRVIESRW